MPRVQQPIAEDYVASSAYLAATPATDTEKKRLRLSASVSRNAKYYTGLPRVPSYTAYTALSVFALHVQSTVQTLQAHA